MVEALLASNVELEATTNVISSFFPSPSSILSHTIFHLIQEGSTPLHLASQKGHKGVVEALLSAKVTKDTQDNVIFPSLLFKKTITSNNNKPNQTN